MNELVGAIAGALILSAILGVAGYTYPDGYKQGQIDALTGVIKYELVVHPDKTSTWEEKK